MKPRFCTFLGAPEDDEEGGDDEAGGGEPENFTLFLVFGIVVTAPESKFAVGSQITELYVFSCREVL